MEVFWVYKFLEFLGVFKLGYDKVVVKGVFKIYKYLYVSYYF